MRASIFKRLPIIDRDEEEKMDLLDVGEAFLFGRHMIDQRENKKAGQPISYYRVIGKSKNGVEYTPVYDYMEKDKGEET